jgi:hypothetical protein
MSGRDTGSGRSISPFRATALLLRQAVASLVSGQLVSSRSQSRGVHAASLQANPAAAGPVRVGKVMRLSHAGQFGSKVIIRWEDTKRTESVWVPRAAVKPGQRLKVVGRFCDGVVPTETLYYIDRVERVLHGRPRFRLWPHRGSVWR